MREILFRGKRVDNGEWIEGFYGVKGEDTDIEVNCIIKSTLSTGTTSYFYFSDYDVKKETVGQFIGLTDKNGVKIFEGDVLKSVFSYKDKWQEIIGVVEKDVCNPCFVIHYKYDGDGHDCYEYDFVQVGLRTNEVIGNIHENPELS